MKTILITGINGYLGSHLARRLLLNYHVIGLEPSIKNLFRINDLGLKVYPSSSESLESVFNAHDVDIIIHTATLYGRNNESNCSIIHSNLIFPLELLQVAIPKKDTVFINTDTALDPFVSSYALTKNQFRGWLYFYRKSIQVINVKLEHFYGPMNSKNNFISNMIDRLKKNEPEIDLTLGEQERDFIFIEDVVEAYRLIVDSCPFSQEYSEFQVASGNLIKIKDLMILLKEFIGSQSALNFGVVPYRENELMRSKSDNTSLISIGWTPKYSLEMGLRQTIEEEKSL